MSNLFLHNVLSSGKDSPTEDIISIVIFVVFGIVVFLKNIITAKMQQKRTAASTSSQKTSAKAEKTRSRNERFEQFLESILQPKNVPQQKPQISVEKNANQPVVVPKKAAPPAAVKENIFSLPPADFKIYKIPSEPVSETALGSSILNLPSIDIALPELLEKKEYSNESEEIPAGKKQKSHLVGRTDGLLPAFSDSDDLRLAILYSEILGKPISMRETLS